MNEAFALAAYGLRPGPLGVVADPFERAVYASSWQLQMRTAHDGCDLSAFCRNPLHPGPCKGWKHHLGLVSPGALHALEKARHDKLEEKRKAKVAALLAEGKKVPAHLKKPIVYDPAKSPFINNPEHGKVTPGLGIPTQGLTEKAAQETLAKIPTKAQVGEKLDAKHAAEAAAEAKKINVGDAVQHKGSWNHHIVVQHNPDGTTTLEHAGTPGKGVTKVPTAGLEKLTGEDAKKALAAHENAKLAGNPTMLTISKAGLKDGDQVFLHGTGDGSPKLVTVRKVIGGGGGMKAGKSVSYEFVGEDGKTLPQTAGASAKWALSPAPGKSFPEAGESKLGKLAAVAEHQDKAKAGADAMVLAAKLMSGKHLSDQAHGHLVVQLSGHHEAGSIADQADQFAPAAAKKLAAKAWKQTDINNHVHQAELEKALEKDIHDGIVKGGPTPVLHALADSLKTLGQDEQGADEKLAKAVAAKLGTKGSGPDVPNLGPSEVHVATDPFEQFNTPAHAEAAAMVADTLSPDEHHAAIINVAHNIDKAEFEKALTTEQQHKFLTKLDDAAQVAHEKHDPAMTHKADEAYKKLTGGSAPAAVPIAPNPSVSSPMDDISHVTKPQTHAPHVQEAVDYANGFKAGTDTKKLAAYQKLSQADIDQLDPNTKQLMKANASKMATKFLDKKKKAAAVDVLAKLNASTGGAGAGGAGAANIGQAEKIKVGLETMEKFHGALGQSHTPENTAAYTKLFEDQHSKNNMHAFAPTLADYYAKEISKANGDSLPEVHAELAKEIEHGLNGEKHPTPLLDAAATGDTFNFVKAVHDHPITGPALKKAVGLDSGGGAGTGGTSTHVPPVSTVPAQSATTTLKSGVILLKHGQALKIVGQMKSFPEGQYLESPPDKIWDNLIAIAAHEQVTPMQALASIDAQNAVKLGLTNKKLLEEKVRSWLSTADGKTYAEAHKVPAQSKLDHLKGLEKGASTSFTNTTGIKLEPGEKVQRIGGPGVFDTSKTEASFAKVSTPEAATDQDKLKKELGVKFSAAQKAALRDYVEGSYAINGWLRDEYKPDQSSIDHAILIQSMMLPIPKDQLLLRGTGWTQFPPEYRSFEGLSKLVGETVQEPAFLSTSVSGSASGFGGDVKMHIEAPKGTMGVFTKDAQFPNGVVPSFLGDEAEMLLAANTQLHIQKVWKEGGTVHVLMRVVSQ